MIGFGSIARELAADRAPFRLRQGTLHVIDPTGRTASCSTSAASASCISPSPGELSRDARQAADRGRRPGFCVNLSVDTRRSTSCVIAARSARSTSTPSSSRGRASISTRRAATRRAPITRCARRCKPSGARDRAVRRRSRAARQSGHGVVVRQTGAHQSPSDLLRDLATRRRRRRRARTGRLAQRLGVKGVHIAERDTQRAKQPKPRNVFVNTWSVEASSPRHAAGRARWARTRPGRRPTPASNGRLRRGDLSRTARRNTACARDADAQAQFGFLVTTTSRSRSPTTTRCATAGRGGLPADLPLRYHPATTLC